jgi:hypothetical protein
MDKYEVRRALSSSLLIEHCKYEVKISPHRHRYHILVAMLHHLDVLNHSHDMTSGSHTLPHDLFFPLLLPAVNQTDKIVTVNVSAAHGTDRNFQYLYLQELTVLVQ